MFGSTAALIAVIVLAMFSAGGIAYALLSGRIGEEDVNERRLEFIQGKQRDAATAMARQVETRARQAQQAQARRPPAHQAHAQRQQQAQQAQAQHRRQGRQKKQARQQAADQPQNEHGHGQKG